jgi:dTDP-4-amino-4,6-dideoxygalactose transaminase
MKTPRPIPLLDLKAQWEEIREEVVPALLQVLDSQRFILGPEVEALERELAGYLGGNFAVAVASGTDALLLALRAVGVGPGHEVITTAYSFFASASTAVLLGARPVFVDIDPGTYNLNPDLIEEAINERTKAIVPVHLFGQPAEMTPILELGRRYGVAVVEDTAQAIGARYRGVAAGTLGDAGCFSFYPSKNLGGLGDGGMVLTAREDLAWTLRELRVHGASQEYHHRRVGYNSRLDALQAAALRVKLRHLDRWTQARRRHAEQYNRLFTDTAVVPPWVIPEVEPVYNNYVIRVSRRDELVAHLREQGIGAAVYYPVPLHRLECFAPLVPEGLLLPEAERASRETLAIPVYPELTDEDVERVAAVILEFYRGSG